MMGLPLSLVITACLFGHVDSLSLSPVENMLFGSRLASIQDEIRSKLANTADMPKRKGTDIVAIFPGAGGVDAFTNELEEKIRQSDVEAGVGEEGQRWITTIDWKKHRGGAASAAFDGEAVGEAVAESVALLEPRSVHCIGISVGAFCAHSMAETLSKWKTKPHVRLTLLDPFCSRGLWGVGYGSKTFGVCADYAEQFLNTDDPVPTTNDPLPNLSCVDVTNAPQRASFQLPPEETMHCWPVAHYSKYEYKSQADKNGRVVLPEHDQTRERGTVFRVA